MKLGRFSAIHAPVQRIYKRPAVVAANSNPTPVYYLDAANYLAVPTTGSTVAGTGNHTITVSNSGSRLSWNAANGGVFRFTGTGTSTTDTMYGGPNYVTGQSYTVFMAYKLSTSALGRLLNTQNEAVKDWLMGSYSNGATSWMNVFYPNNTVNLNSDVADANWHFIWGTYDSTTTVAKLYIATDTQPAAVYKTTTNGANGGFNQLRLFSRSAGSEVQTGDIGFVKVWNSELTLAQIQTEHATYKTRFYP
jgi:Concanavalin A-like lectin/glucanases superfamily